MSMSVSEAVGQAQEKLSAVVESTSRGEAKPIGTSASAPGVGADRDGFQPRFRHRRPVHRPAYDLDDKLGGLRPGQLIIVAGRPGMGKTALSPGGTPHRRLRHAFPGAVHGNAGNRTGRPGGRPQVAKLSVADMMRGRVRDEDWAALTHGLSHREGLPMLVDEQGGLSFVEAAARSGWPAASTASAWRFWTTCN